MKHLQAILTVCWILLLAWLSSGCVNAVSMPSPLTIMNTPPSTLGKASDIGIVLYATQSLDSYAGGSLTNEIITLGGAATAYGLGTAAAIAPAQARGYLLGVNALMALAALWRPIDRTTLYSQGAGLIRESLGEYLKALIVEGYCTVPDSRVTTSGAILFSEVNGIIQQVENARAGILDLGSRSLVQLQTSRAEKPLLSRQTVIPEGCR